MSSFFQFYKTPLDFEDFLAPERAWGGGGTPPSRPASANDEALELFKPDIDDIMDFIADRCERDTSGYVCRASLMPDSTVFVKPIDSSVKSTWLVSLHWDQTDA